MSTNQTPPSKRLKKIKEVLFDYLWTWFTQRPFPVKILLILCSVLIAFMAGRLNFLGDNAYKYSKIIYPFHIKYVDPSVPVIPIILTYEVEDKMGRRSGKIGGTCISSDTIHLNGEVGIASWVSIFAVDSKGIYPILSNNLDPSFLEKDQLYTRHFTLDNTVGNEVYYAIASLHKFSFEKEIRNHILLTTPSSKSKGPSFSDYNLTLPDKFSSSYIYFKHLSAK